MKKFSLKKITAAVSAAAMIATLGTTAFAASPVSADQDGDGITITDVTVERRQSDTNLYDVSVSYSTTEDQNIGVTMLTYVKHGESLTTATAYTKGDMNIVGVDQKNDKAAFTFTVTTQKNEETGIYMTPGESGLIMLSGDNNVKVPAVAVLTIPAPAAVKATADDVSVDVYSYDNTDAIKQKIAEQLKDKTASIYASSDEGATPVANYKFTGSEEATLAQVDGQPNKYTYTVKIQEGAKLDKTTVSIPANFTCTVNVTVNTIAWMADTIELKGENTVSLTKGDVKDTTINDAVKAALIAKGFVIKDSDGHSADVTNAGADSVIGVVSTGESYNADAIVDQTLTYKVTATNAESKKNDVTLAKLGSGTIEGISVTVAALEENQFIVSKVEATKGGTAVTSVSVPNGTTEAAAKTALSDAIDNITVKNATGDVTESGWTVDGEWTFNKTYDATKEDAETYTATISIKAPTESGDKEGVNRDNIKLTLTLNVAAKPAGILGDVDGSGTVDKKDVTYLARYNAGWAGYTLTNEALADVDGSGTVDKKDTTALARHVAGWRGYETLPYKK